MLGRVLALTLVLSLLTMVAPGPLSSVDEAAAGGCDEIDPMCLNEVGCYVAESYENLKDKSAVLDKYGPTLYCLY